MIIHVFADVEAVAREAANFIAGIARQDILARGRFVMAVSGGRTPWQMLCALGQEDIPWKDVHIVQVDERLAPAGHPERNLTLLHESLLENTRVIPEQIYAMPVGNLDPEIMAENYALTLQRIAGNPPVLDLIHLGMGNDGHTASLFPGDPVLKILDKDVALTGLYQGRRRMTLTYPVINRSRRILWIITGREKVEMFKRLREADESIPAGCVSRSKTIVIVDKEAAGKA
jgi:6-phosphogluconolactonase